MLEILLSYVRKNLKMFCYLLISGIVFVTVFYLYGVPFDAVGYAFLLAGAIGLVGVGIDFISYVKKYRMLQRMVDKITFELETFPEIKEMHEKEYVEALIKLYELKEQLESKICIDRQEMTDYYTLWVHQIKVPIAALRLLLQSGEMDMSAMSAELFKIEQYVEMVLSYLRMESISADMVLQEYSLGEIVKQAVRKYSKLFILKKIKLEFSDVDTKVITDEKWVEFVIEQLLSNALKYTNEGKIAIYMDSKQKNVLVIEDTGMGIQAEDLPRVMEKGFTGYNGRADKKSTGLGLYLCKTVLDKLGHRIWLESEPDVGTKVYISFERDSNLTIM